MAAGAAGLASAPSGGYGGGNVHVYGAAASGVDAPGSGRECPLCLIAVKDVVLRPCGHTLCAGCLSSLAQRAGGNETAVSCPICRQRVEGSMRFYM